MIGSVGNAEQILCVERYGTRKDSAPSFYLGDTRSGKVRLQDESRSVSSLTQIAKVWDTVQAFCSSITGALATQAVLKGAGVGDDTANVASATITWLLKDGTGMVGRIAFAYYKGANLDQDAKKWRLFGDVLNDCAILTTLLAPMFPKQYFTVISCLAGFAFSLVGVAGGCTRAAITMHQAKRDNMADVSAKDGSQETMVNLAALLINLVLIPTISGNPVWLWVLFILFTFLHIFANYKAVTSVIMDTLNYARFKVVFNHYYTNESLGEILSPKEANALEPIIGGHYLAALRDTATAVDVIMAYHDGESHKQLGTLHQESSMNFIEKLKRHGWDVTRHHLQVDEWRWSTERSDKTD